MSMTTELIERLRQHADTFEKTGFAVDGLVKDYREAADTIQLLSEKLHTSQTEPYFWGKCPYYEPDIMFDGKEEYDWGKCTYKTVHSDDRKNCPNRHENGNCLSVGGFCLAVDDKHCQLKKEPCGKDINVPATDAISRQAAVSVANDFDATMVVRGLEKLPSVRPKQKIGHWILTDGDFVYCSECEDSYYPRPIDASWYYCPHCGAKMKEGE